MNNVALHSAVFCPACISGGSAFGHIKILCYKFRKGKDKTLFKIRGNTNNSFLLFTGNQVQSECHSQKYECPMKLLFLTFSTYSRKSLYITSKEQNARFSLIWYLRLDYRMTRIMPT